MIKSRRRDENLYNNFPIFEVTVRIVLSKLVERNKSNTTRLRLVIYLFLSTRSLTYKVNIEGEQYLNKI